MPLDTEHRSALRALGNFQALFAVQSGHRQICTKRRLRDAHGNCAIKVSATALKKRMLFDIEDYVQIAARSAIHAGFAFSRHAQTSAGIHARWNPQIDCLVAFDAALSAAIRAALLDNLSRALARRASPRDREESLLIGKL